MCSVSFRYRKYFLVMIAILVLTISMGTEGCAQADRESEDKTSYSLTWVADYGEGEQVYSSSYGQKQWSVPLQVSSATGMVFHAVSSSGSDGAQWVVWSEQNQKGSFLHYSVKKASVWSPSRRIETGMTDNKFSSIIVDRKNTPWIAWTASKESYSDIFWCKWTGNQWGRAVKAHADNDVPDINPSLLLTEDGDVLLSWKTIKDGGYVNVSQVWDGSDWQVVAGETAKKKTMDIVSGATTLSFPENFAEDPHKTSLCIKSTEGTVSVPFSFVQAIPVSP